nr:hypothetical protein LOC_Os11g18030 [Oryza sativa Japonica Group]
MVLLTNAPNIANMMNMVSYLRGTMHMGVAQASTTASNYFAALQMFSIPAAFLADSYLKRFYTVLLFAPIEIIWLAEKKSVALWEMGVVGSGVACQASTFSLIRM